MHIGQKFRLKSFVRGIHSDAGHRTAIVIPEGSTVEVVSGPLDDPRMIDAHWRGRTVTVFAEDLARSGDEVKSVRKNRSGSAG